MAQRYAGSGCVDGSSWSGAIGRSCLTVGGESFEAGPRVTVARDRRESERHVQWRGGLGLTPPLRLLT
jgi:hypothetical protein